MSRGLRGRREGQRQPRGERRDDGAGVVVRVPGCCGPVAHRPPSCGGDPQRAVQDHLSAILGLPRLGSRLFLEPLHLPRLDSTLKAPVFLLSWPAALDGKRYGPGAALSCCVHVSSLSLQSSPKKSLLRAALFYREGNGSPERSTNLPKATQLGSKGLRFTSVRIWCQDRGSDPSAVR